MQVHMNGPVPTCKHLIDTIMASRTTAVLTPGLRLILRFFVNNLIPVSSVWLLSRLLTAYNESLHIPTALVVLAAFLSIPATFSFRIVLKNLRTRRAAKRMGAILPPRWDGRSFGNFDLLQHTVDRFQNGYIGQCHDEWWSASILRNYQGKASGTKSTNSDTYTPSTYYGIVCTPPTMRMS